MKYLKYFESKSEPTLKEKLESIVDMAYYLIDNNMNIDMNNFIGECSYLFSGCIDKKPYRYNIDYFINEIPRFWKPEERLKMVDTLYKISLSKKHTDTIEDIKELLKPIMEYELFGGKLFKSLRIKKTYTLDWTSSIYSPSFTIKLKISDDVLTTPIEQITNFEGSERREVIKEIKLEFQKVFRITKRFIDNMGFENYIVELSENVYNDDFENIILKLIQK